MYESRRYSMTTTQLTPEEISAVYRRYTRMSPTLYWDFSRYTANKDFKLTTNDILQLLYGNPISEDKVTLFRKALASLAITVTEDDEVHPLRFAEPSETATLELPLINEITRLYGNTSNAWENLKSIFPIQVGRTTFYNAMRALPVPRVKCDSILEAIRGQNIG